MRKKVIIKENNRIFHQNYRKAVTKFVRTLRLRRDNKSRLFVKLFSNKKELLDLYNALNGSDYSDPNMITVTTIDDFLYVGYKNDCSFIIGNVLNLYEHQSTLNPNMPMRGLEYFADIYRAYIVSNELNIYGTALVKLPTPVYVVFYNGDTETADRFEYRLSDAFEGEGGCLECVVTVININQGHNAELLGKCKTLMGYSIFVSKVREYIQTGHDHGTAADMAVEYCIEQDILKKYFLKHRSEVVHMFPADYDMRIYKRILKKDYERRLEKEVAEKVEEQVAQKVEEQVAQKVEEQVAQKVEEQVARKVAEKATEKDAEWATVVADKDAEIARLRKEIEMAGKKS